VPRSFVRRPSDGSPLRGSSTRARRPALRRLCRVSARHGARNHRRPRRGRVTPPIARWMEELLRRSPPLTPVSLSPQRALSCASRRCKSLPLYPPRCFLQRSSTIYFYCVPFLRCVGMAVGADRWLDKTWGGLRGPADWARRGLDGCRGPYVGPAARAYRVPDGAL